MIIIAFSARTSKILPRILCRHFRHCAPIISTTGPGKSFVMYQFVRRGCVATFHMNARDMNILRANGWEFICIPDANTHNIATGGATCVQFTKRTVGMHHIWIQTPDALYKHLIKTAQ